MTLLMQSQLFCKKEQKVSTMLPQKTSQQIMSSSKKLQKPLA